MSTILDASDNALESAGAVLLEQLGQHCIRGQHVRLRELSTDASLAADEHLEIDYLIAAGRVALLGEITARQDKRSIERKYDRFRRHLQLLQSLPRNDAFWRRLGVDPANLGRFRQVNQLIGFFMTTQANEFDVRLRDTSNVFIFYRSTIEVLETYARCIGHYARPHFLDRLGIKPRRGRRPLEIRSDSHGLLRISDRRIVTGDGPEADLFTFEVSPYDSLFDVSRVFRNDELPSFESDGLYQRPLIPSKLGAIRKLLLANPTFVFPNSILAVLSSHCEYSRYDNVEILRIPHEYGALEIVEGQHRLFSFASDDVKNVVVSPTILISAILFRTGDSSVIRRESARTFVEINTTQTTIDPLHLNAIAYPILGETSDQALAAAVLLNVTKTEGPLQGLIQTSKSALGTIRASTVLTYIKPLTRISRIAKLANATRGRPLKAKQGFEILFDVEDIVELSNAGVLIDKASIAMRHYFNLVRKVFLHDFPRRNTQVSSAMRYAKVFASFIKLLDQFVSEGLNWQQVEAELERIRENVKALRRLKRYRAPLLNLKDRRVPDDKPSVNENYRFLNDNRMSPTSMGRIMNR